MSILLAEPQNTHFSTGPVVVWVETIPLCQGLVFATRLQRPESMPDGMGCHSPMKLRGQNSRSQRKTKINFSCIPQIAPRHRGNDCQIRWSVSISSLLIITMASTLNGRINPTSQGCENVAELLLQHLFGLGTDVDRPRRCAAAL